MSRTSKSKSKNGVHQFSLDDIQPLLQPSSSANVQFTVQRVSEDGRRQHRAIHQAAPTSPVKRKLAGLAQQAHLAATRREVGLEFDIDVENLSPASTWDHVEKHLVEAPRSRKKRYLSSDQPLAQWKQHHDEYLAELIRLEGRGEGDNTVCPTCDEDGQAGAPLYRCRDCRSMELVCGRCCIKAHSNRPLDVIEKWNGECFERVALRDMGLVMQLGHPLGATCAVPHPLPSDFTVIHTNGFHKISGNYCGCHQGAGSWREQLLRHEWYPATHEEPRTCCTFRVLEMFHLLTLQGKMTTYDFYNGIEKLTDNTGTRKISDRYHSFLRVVREWRHLKMLKRGGRGNDGERKIDATMPGEIAVECPACPRPGVNLPEGWEKADRGMRSLYILFLAIDTCFRLKRKLISSEKKDPGLGTGWAYFVEDTAYRAFLLTVTDQDEMSTCTGLAALDHANTKYLRGYATMGCGLGVCARHEFVQKNGVADLQKGERYVNMDYIVASILRLLHARLRKVLSYDINCQYSKKIADRMKKLPPLLRFVVIAKLFRFVIPKLHIHGHTLACQLLFSLNLLPEVGRTDGEGIERPWANIGPVSTSTREMGPGSRHDTLDDHLGHWNWQKLVGLGLLLSRRLVTAEVEKERSKEMFEGFTLNQLEQEDGPAKLKEWRDEVLAWEGDSSKPNPYDLPKSGVTVQDVRLALAEEEAKEAAAGVPALHDIGPSEFILAGLDLEEQMLRLRLDVQRQPATSVKRNTDITTRRTKLMRQMDKYRALQSTSTPAVIQALAKLPPKFDDKGKRLPPPPPEQTPLLLPSQLTSEELSAGCTPGIADIERRIRDAQCRTALDHLRNHLLMKSRLLTYKGSHARHQGATTRSRGLIDRNEAKVTFYAAKYQIAWSALWRFCGRMDDRVGWRKLEKKHIRCMEDVKDGAKKSLRKVLGKNSRGNREAGGEEIGEDALMVGVGEEAGADEGRAGAATAGGEPREGEKDTSWIWTGADSGGGFSTDKALQDGLRVEWAKTWARSRRWDEEVDLLKEEMRRVLISLEWKACWWEDRRVVAGFTASHREGVSAYASSQARLLRGLGKHFQKLWEGASTREPVVETGAGASKEDIGEEEEEDEGDEEGEEEEGQEEAALGDVEEEDD